MSHLFRARARARARARSLLFLGITVVAACSRTQPQPPPKPEPAPAPPVAAKDDKPALHPPVDPAPRPSPGQRGAEHYAKMCAICHGANGEGYKADQATALAQPDFLASVSDEFLAFAIAVGRRGTTMSAWAQYHGGPLGPNEIGDVVSFLRSWQRQPRAQLDDSPPHGDAARGKALFEAECEKCHGDKAPNVRILNRQWLAYAKPGFIRYALQKGRPPTAMPSFQDKLGDEGIEDVVTYLRSLPSFPDEKDLVGIGEPPPIPLGPVPLNPKGPEPTGFKKFPQMTSLKVIGPQYKRKARMALLDARAPSDYAQGHIAGAVSVPFYDPVPYFEKLPKNAWLVCYCGCPHAESGALARKLVDAGFSKVTVLDEGLGAWMQEGYATKSGLAP
ncbi:MAG TPA: c-type cytochrome [Polyangiales bacterium]|nr:c-type cytochrome [Polyangiales bacterium]